MVFESINIKGLFCQSKENPVSKSNTNDKKGEKPPDQQILLLMLILYQISRIEDYQIKPSIPITKK